MGVYTRADSPFYQLHLERAGQKGLKEPTSIRIDAPTAEMRKDNRYLADLVYHARMTELARETAGLVEETEPDRETIAFTAYADWYEIHITRHKRGRIREEEMIAQLRKPFDGLLLHEVTRDKVLEWKTARLADVSAGTWNRELDVLKHMLSLAVPKYLKASPIAGLKRQRGIKRELRILTPDEEQRLLKVMAPDDRAMVIMALDTLMRLSDIVDLRREQDHRQYLTVLDPKVGESYKVPVSKRLRKALDVLPTADPYYFHRRRVSQVPRDTIRQVLELACKEADVTYGRGKNGITFHSLRHTGASRMVERGVDLRTVQELGGWKNLRQLTRYTHPTEEAKRRAVELVGRRAVRPDADRTGSRSRRPATPDRAGTTRGRSLTAGSAGGSGRRGQRGRKPRRVS